MATFPERLKELREAQGYKQEELGDLLGLTGSAVGAYEKKKKPSQPSLETLNRLADHFKVTLDYLAGRSDDRISYTPVPQEWRPLIREATEKSIHPRQLHMAMLLIEDVRERLAGVPEDPLPPEWRQWVQELIDTGLDLDVAKQVIKSVTAYEEAMKAREKGRG